MSIQTHTKSKGKPEQNTQPKPKSKSIRYSMALPNELYEHLQAVADAKQMSVVDVIRLYLKIGLLITDVEGQENAALIIREGDREREIIIPW